MSIDYQAALKATSDRIRRKQRKQADKIRAAATEQQKTTDLLENNSKQIKELRKQVEDLQRRYDELTDYIAKKE